MKNKLPFKFLKPSFCAGLLEDPLLLLCFKSKNNNILVDCGQLNHLAKRILKSIGMLFVSHAHMDHFIGFDSFTRSVLVSNKTIDVFGPEGIAKRAESRLKAYNWNLTEPYYCKYRIHEISPEVTSIFFLDGSKGFSLERNKEYKRKSNIIFENSHVIVEAAICDHKIPVLIYKFTEKPGFEVCEEKVVNLGYKSGPWINQLKEWYYLQSTEGAEIEINCLDSSTQKIKMKTLYDAIKRESPKSSVGYVTDVGFTQRNVDIICDLMKGIDLLVTECTYLKENKPKARESYHLCTEDVNCLLEAIKPEFFLPMHLSKTYLHCSEDFYEELSPPQNCQLITLPERMAPPPLLLEKMNG